MALKHRIARLLGAGQPSQPIVTPENPNRVAVFFGRNFIPYQKPVVISATQALASNGNRFGLIVWANGSNCYIGADNTVSSTTGFLLPANQPVVLNTLGPVWCIAPAGGTTIFIAETI